MTKGRFIPLAAYVWFLLSTFCFRLSAQYYVDWYTIDGGGGTSRGVTYSVSGTLGQPDAGPRMNGVYYSVDGGFWSIFAPAQTVSSPRLQTAPATGITGTSATLNSIVNPGNLPTLAYFQWGATTNYGNVSGTNSLLATNAALNVSIALTGLAPFSTYHFRAVAVNGAGTSFGADLVFSTVSAAGGTWTPLAQAAPGGVTAMVLLSDGAVLAETDAGPWWYRLTPDVHGSYVNGTWSIVAPMDWTRIDFASVVLRDGRVLVVGGEYGDGDPGSQVYDPVADTWSINNYPPCNDVVDAEAVLLPDGQVLLAPDDPLTTGGTLLYNPTNDSWQRGPTLVRGPNQVEASWVKLPDDSILTIDTTTTNSERYIPSLNQWLDDGGVPAQMWDATEIGAAFLLPNGNAFFLGGLGHTAIYTPTGTTSPGTWTAGPDIPNGLAPDDAPAAMMANGKILCQVSGVVPPFGSWPPTSTFYEYDWRSNSFTQVNAPGGALSFADVTYDGLMLDLPDGTVLFAHRSSDLYVYQPVGPPLAAGKPTISSITTNSDGSYHLLGTGLNGISAGAAFGDDAQMDSNYPLVRLTNSLGQVYYCRTYNWSRTGVMTGNAPVSTEFSLPNSLPANTYGLVVVANGIASDPVPFTAGTALGISPGTNVIASGVIGGPFFPNQQIYSLTNSGSSALTWSVGNDVAWLSVYPRSGIFPSGAMTNVTANLLVTTNYLLAGTYPATLWFTNLNEGSVQTRKFTLQVQPNASIIQNPGFEIVYSTNVNFGGQIVAIPEPVAWTLVSGTPLNDSAFGADFGTSPHSGTNDFLFFTSFAAGSDVLRQVVPTTPGTTYLLSLWLLNPSGPSYFAVSWGGSYVYQNSNVPVFANWLNLQFLVSASAPNTTLDLTGESGYGLYVDDVSLMAVPQPACKAEAVNTGTFAFTWNALPGLNYQLQYKTNLAQTAWLNLGAPLTATNSVQGASDTIGPDPQRFYQVLPLP